MIGTVPLPWFTIEKMTEQIRCFSSFFYSSHTVFLFCIVQYHTVPAFKTCYISISCLKVVVTGSWHVFNLWTQVHWHQIHDNSTFCYKKRSWCNNYGIVVISVALNRPEKMNAMNNLMWEEIGAVFDRLARDPDCRAIVLRQGERVKSCWTSEPYGTAISYYLF